MFEKLIIKKMNQLKLQENSEKIESGSMKIYLGGFEIVSEALMTI